MRPLLLRRLFFFLVADQKDRLKMGGPRPCLRLSCTVPRWRCVQTRLVKEAGIWHSVKTLNLQNNWSAAGTVGSLWCKGAVTGR